MRLTERQREAIEHRGSNLLVSASAGSGKTEVLARRCVSLIADAVRPLDVDRMLVVTFTRAAAAELRERIGRMLREEAELTADRSLRRHLRKQQALIETAEIGTIDAWCARLAREHFDKLTPGVDPGFATLSVEDAAILRGEVLDELFEWIYTGEDETAEAGRSWIRRHSQPSDEFLRGLVERLNRYREHLVNPEWWLRRQREACAGDDETLQKRAAEVLAGALREECGFQLGQIEGTLRQVRTGEIRGHLEGYREALRDWEKQAGEADKIEATAEAICAYRFPRKPKGCDEQDFRLREEIKKRWHEKRLKKRWAPDRVSGIVRNAGATGELGGALLRLEERYHEMLMARKRGRGAYEFGDVLRMALDLLGEEGEGSRREATSVARSLQERYEHILVDEYQDTSPVQVELLRLASRSEAGRTNRFMVGDVKQSIYGFREAEPRLLSALIEDYRERRREGDVLFLPDNFRSHGRLVEGLNEIFAGLFELEFGGARYEGEQRLRAGREEIANATLDGTPRIEMLIVAHDAEGADYDGGDGEDEGEDDEAPLERIEREGLIAARRIRELFDGGAMTPERDEEGALRLRPMRWSDVVILLRSAKKAAGLLATTLREAGIPCAAAGRESVLESVEVRDARAAMALAVNRQQDIPLAAYLRGPMVGLTEGELLRVRGAAEEDSFYKAVEAYRSGGGDAELARKLDEATAKLDAWGAAARTEAAPNLLRRIIRETSLEHFARSAPGGEHRAAMLQALVNMAEDGARRGRSGLAEFVDYLDKLDARDVSPDAAAAVGEDVVRIMTIHAAKGLEFPAVFLLGAGTSFWRRPSRGALECDEQGGMGLTFFDYAASEKLVSAELDVNRQRAAQRELEEELRLFYVAATRAREKLYVIGHGSAEAWEDWQKRYAEGGDEIPLIARLGAGSMLEWMMQGAARGRLCEGRGGAAAAGVETFDADDLTAPEALVGEELEAPKVELTEADRAWAARGREAMLTGPDWESARRPAVLSVSAVKQAAARESDADLPLSMEHKTTLGAPAFGAGEAVVDGRTVGDAYHRFMQFADLARLGTAEAIGEQMREMVEAGRLEENEARLIESEDIAWFAGTEIGRTLRSGGTRVRREAPFVYAYPAGTGDERVILRGVIDCLIETDGGLVVLDYKTDRPVDEDDWRRRLAGYRVQLQLYAAAAGAVFGRDVCAAKLAFLRERRIETADVGAPRLAEIMERLREE